MSAHFIWFLVSLVLAILWIAYDSLRQCTIDWLDQNKVLFPTYPWYVKLDHWIYHREAARVAHVLFEQHILFGGRLRILGNIITNWS